MSDNYITKEEVLSFVEEMEKRTYGDDLITKTVLVTTKCVKDFVMHMLPADVQPVVHGEWIKTMDGNAFRDKCSECESLYPNAHGYNYCPNCGAKMGKEQTNDRCTTNQTICRNRGAYHQGITKTA